jgi:hypothetical protein
MLKPKMARLKIYTTLAAMDHNAEGSIRDWLNANGNCNVTVCPACHVEDFSHVEGCPVLACIAQGRRLAEDASAIAATSGAMAGLADALKTASPFVQEQR